MKRALRHVERLHRTTLTAALKQRLLARPNSHMGRLAESFLQIIGHPGILPVPSSPITERAPLQLSQYVQGLGLKSDVSSTVSRQLTEELIATTLKVHECLFTDGSVQSSLGTASVAYACPSL